MATLLHKQAYIFCLNFVFADLAQAVVDAGAVPLLVLSIQEPEIALKRIAASALSDIAKHSPEVILDTAAVTIVTYVHIL